MLETKTNKNTRNIEMQSETLLVVTIFTNVLEKTDDNVTIPRAQTVLHATGAGGNP